MDQEVKEEYYCKHYDEPKVRINWSKQVFETQIDSAFFPLFCSQMAKCSKSETVVKILELFFLSLQNLKTPNFLKSTKKLFLIIFFL